MIKLNKIYTRTGDDGTTGLVNGPRRPKNDIRICAYGTVEEANAFVGQARQHASKMVRIDMLLKRIQNDLFDVGSDLAAPDQQEDPLHPNLRITQEQIDWLEQGIDHANQNLTPLTSFILPGGNAFACALHVARTVVRRAEREAVDLGLAEPETSKLPQTYLNRLSDLLFVLARMANDNGASDVLWQPGLHTGHDKG